jgi:hypothetical protein
MRRIFYFSGYRMKVFEWRQKKILGSHTFEPDEDGFQHFADYLAACVPMPGQLLIDVIEEDFRRESIPMVSGKDRKIVLQRLVDRHYRGAPYVNTQSLGRTELAPGAQSKRREEQILISSIATTDLLESWLKRLDAAKVPLAGIWSVPLLTVAMLKILGISGDHKLVVSRQVRSAVRESYFKKGTLVFSRQAKLDAERRDDDSVETFLFNLHQVTEQTYRFLTNQRIMGFTDKMDIICITPDASLDEIQKQSKDTNVFKHRFLGLNALAQKMGFDLGEETRADVIYAFLCSRAPLSQDHYGSPAQKRFYYHLLFDRGISFLNTIGVLLIVTGAALLGLHSIELRQQSQHFQKEQQLLELRFLKEFEENEYQLEDAPLVREAVFLAHDLALETNQTPEKFFSPLANILSSSQFRAIHLLSIDWKKQYPSELAQERELIKTARAVPGVTNTEEEGMEEELSVYPQAVLRIGGRVDADDIPYRQTVKMMEAFVQALSTMDGVEGLAAVKMPVDVRPNARFNDVDGIIGEDTRDHDRNDFEVLVIMKAMIHASTD